jgi:hypothetical protein
VQSSIETSSIGYETLKSQEVQTSEADYKRCEEAVTESETTIETAEVAETKFQYELN